jgi:CspA family cold shock protein
VFLPLLSLQSLTGTVKRWDNQKGYGFIGPDIEGQADVFVHQSVLVIDGYRVLNEDERVEYELMVDDKTGKEKAARVMGPGGAPLQGVWGGQEVFHGTVNGWRADRGFGFIKPDTGGDDIFVHQSVIVSTDYRRLEVCL